MKNFFKQKQYYSVDTQRSTGAGTTTLIPLEPWPYKNAGSVQKNVYVNPLEIFRLRQISSRKVAEEKNSKNNLVV